MFVYSYSKPQSFKKIRGVEYEIDHPNMHALLSNILKKKYVGNTLNMQTK